MNPVEKRQQTIQKHLQRDAVGVPYAFGNRKRRRAIAKANKISKAQRRRSARV